MRRIALALTLALGLLTGSGCGADDPLYKALQATSKAGGVEMRLTGSVIVAGLASPVTMSGSGLADNATGRGSMTLTIAGIPGAGDVSIDELVTDQAVYVRMPQLAGSLGPGKTWLEARTGDTAGSRKLSGLTSGAGADPTQLLRLMRGSKGSKQVAAETVNGVRTTRYRTSVDVGEVAAGLGGQAKEAVKQFTSQLHVSSIPMDVWVDSAGLVRRLLVGWTQEPLPGQTQTISMQLDLLRYGVKVDVTPPPASQVADVTDLAGFAGGLPAAP